LNAQKKELDKLNENKFVNIAELEERNLKMFAAEMSEIAINYQKSVK
jgi:hypothetical protein